MGGLTDKQERKTDIQTDRQMFYSANHDYTSTETAIVDCELTSIYTIIMTLVDFYHSRLLDS